LQPRAKLFQKGLQPCIGTVSDDELRDRRGRLFGLRRTSIGLPHPISAVPAVPIGAEGVTKVCPLPPC